MNKSYVKSVAVLSLICLIIALALAVVNFVTAPIISEAENAAANAALAEVRPGAKEFSRLDLSEYTDIPEAVNEAYTVDDIGGYVVKLTVKGYKSGLVIMVGIDGNGKVTGAKCLSSNETNGKEVSYGESFIDKTLDNVESVDTIAGSTMTTSAYRNAVKYALGTAAILGGGSFDDRTEEEIKLDEALPSANGDFAPIFITEYLAGLTKVFHANNNTGYVLVFGDEYISTDEAGNVTGAGTNAISAAGFVAGLKASSATELDKTVYAGIPVSITKISKTSTGNYIFEAVSEPHMYSNIPITIRIAISAEGKIIDCLTMGQGEGAGYGDKCADSDYYKQYVGKTETDYSTVIIAGATQSSDKYQGLVRDAYTAYEILKGGM